MKVWLFPINSSRYQKPFGLIMHERDWWWAQWAPIVVVLIGAGLLEKALTAFGFLVTIISWSLFCAAAITVLSVLLTKALIVESRVGGIIKWNEHAAEFFFEFVVILIGAFLFKWIGGTIGSFTVSSILAATMGASNWFGIINEFLEDED